MYLGQYLVSSRHLLTARFLSSLKQGTRTYLPQVFQDMLVTETCGLQWVTSWTIRAQHMLIWSVSAEVTQVTSCRSQTLFIFYAGHMVAMLLGSTWSHSHTHLSPH